MTHLTFIRYFVPDSNEFAPGWYQTRNEGRTRIGDTPLSLSDALYDGPNRVIIDDNTPETNTLPVSGGKGVDEFLITLTANSVVIDDDSEANVIVFERDVVITSIERQAGSEGASVAQYVITLSSGKTITLRNPASFTFQHLGDATRTDPISAEDFFTAYEDGFAASDASHPDIIGDASGPSGVQGPMITGTATGAVYEGDLSTSGDLDVNDDTLLASTTPFTISTQGTYGTASIGDDGEWVYKLDNGNADVRALNSGDTLTDTFVVNITATDGTQAQTITITINGRTDVTGTNRQDNRFDSDSDLGDARTSDNQAIFGFNSFDILEGGSGDDLLVGGYDNDTIDLGSGGADTVVYRINSSDGDGLVKAEDGRDFVIGFTPGEDKLVILDVNGSPTTLAGLFDSLTKDAFRLSRNSGDTNGDKYLSSSELDAGARYLIQITFQANGTDDGGPTSGSAGRTLWISFDRVTSEALNDMAVWDTLTGGTNFSKDRISTVAQLSSLFGGFGRPGYDAALDDGGFISIIGPDDLPSTYFEIVPISGDETGSVTEGGAPGDDNTGTLTTSGNTITLVSKETTDSPGMSTGTYGVMRFNVSSGEWVYTLDDRAEALADQQTATETFIFSAGGATFEVTITITGANDAPTVSGEFFTREGPTGERFTLSNLSDRFTDVDQGDELTFTVTLDDGAALSTIGLTYDSDEDEITGTLPETGTYVIKIVATDKSGATVEATFDPNILSAGPIIQRNSLTYNPDETSITIDETMLEVTSGNASDPALLVYTITTLPDAGMLLKSGTPLNNGDTFTQADINNGLITYVPDVGSLFISQSNPLSFTISDGVESLEATLEITSRELVGNTVYEGDLSTSGDLDVNDDDLLASTTPFTISTQGTYGTASIGDDGEWVYKLDNGNADVRALNSGDTLTDTFVVDVNLASGRAKTQTVTITISGRTDVFGTNGPDSSLGDASTSDNQAIFGFNDEDTLRGGSGDDLLVGGYGRDFIDLRKGGTDTVVYRINSSDGDGLVKAEDGFDNVTEFTPGEDKLVILDVNGSPTTLAGLFDSLTKDAFWLRINRDSNGDHNLSSSELDAGARYFIQITFQANGTDDGGPRPPSSNAGRHLIIIFDRVTSEALNDMAVWDTLTGGTNFSSDRISTVAQLSSLFGGFGRPGYDAALDDGGFISIIGPDDLPDSYFISVLNVDTSGSDIVGAVYEGDPSTSGDLDVNDDTLLDSTTPFTISTQGTYGTASIGDDGEWVYKLDNGNADVRALNSGDTLIDTFVVDVNPASGRAKTQTVTITISGRTEVFGTNGHDSSLGDASTSDNQAIFGFNGVLDRLTGGSGDDLLVGGYGIDFIDLSAGGRDTVVYRINSSDTDGLVKAEDGGDRVTEFTPGEDKFVILDVNGSPTTLAALFDSLTGTFRLAISGDRDFDHNLSSSELDAGARYVIGIGFQVEGTDDGGPISPAAGTSLEIVFDRVTSEALNDMAVWDTLTGGTNFSSDRISTVAQLSSLFGGFGRPGYDAALDDGGFISVIGPDDLPDSYFEIISGAVYEGDPSTSGDLDVNDDTLLASTTPFTISTQGTYGTASIGDDGEWVYKLDNGNADVRALNSGDTLTDTFVVDVNLASGRATTQTVTITISGRTDVFGTNDQDSSLGDASTSDNQAIFGFNDRDSLTGGSGDDLLVGGYGVDEIDLSAGGTDTVVYRINSSDPDGLVKAEDGNNSVFEFTPGEDKLVILDINGSPTTLAGLFDRLTKHSLFSFRLLRQGDDDYSGDLSSSELDAGARVFIEINFQVGGTEDGGSTSTSGYAGLALRIFFDRVTSEALNDRAVWDTLTGGTNFSSENILDVAQLSSLFGGFGRPGYDAALDDGGFISVIGPDDLPDSYFISVLNVDTSGSDIVGAVYEGDLSTSGDLDVNDDTLLASTTPFTISTQGTYGTASIDDDGEWVYKLDNGNADVRALNSGDTLTDTFVVDVNPASGRAKTQTITITISGRTDVRGSNGGDLLGDASTSDNQAIFGFNSRDTLTGGSGDDLLVGGYGLDIIDLSAGGTDTVVYRINSSDGDGLVKGEDGEDRVFGFTPGEDKLVILDVNGSPTTLAGLFDSLTNDAFQLRIDGDDDGDHNLSSSELDAGARYFIQIIFDVSGTDDGGPKPPSSNAGSLLVIYFDRVTSEALNDMAVWDTLTGGTNFSSTTIPDVAQLSSLFGGFGRPGYDAALDDGGFISIIGPDDLPDSYFAIISGDETGSVTEGGAPGDDNTGTLTAPGHTITLVSKETTDSPGMSTGTYGVMRFNASSGEWVYTLDDRAEALTDQQTATETFTFNAGGETLVVTITITGANDAPVVESGNEIGEQAGQVGQEITAIDLSGLFTDVDTGDTFTLTVMVLSSDGSAKSGLDTLGLEYDSDTKMITGTLLNDIVAGPYTIEVIATDDGGSGDASQPSTFDIVVVADGAPVIGGAVDGTIAEDAADPIMGTLTITDAEGDALPMVVLTDGAGQYGTLTFVASADGGVWTYTLDNTNADVQALKDDTLTDKFTFTAEGANPTTVTITITGSHVDMNGSDIVGAAYEGDLSTSGDLDVNDGTLLASTTPFTISTQGTYGTASIGDDGEWVYTLDNGNADVRALNSGDTLTDTFVVDVNPASGRAKTQTITITISGRTDVLGTNGREEIGDASTSDNQAIFGFNDRDCLTGGSGDDLLVAGYGFDNIDLSMGGTDTVVYRINSSYIQGGARLVKAEDGGGTIIEFTPGEDKLVILDVNGSPTTLASLFDSLTKDAFRLHINGDADDSGDLSSSELDAGARVFLNISFDVSGTDDGGSGFSAGRYLQIYFDRVTSEALNDMAVWDTLTGGTNFSEDTISTVAQLSSLFGGFGRPGYDAALDDGGFISIIGPDDLPDSYFISVLNVDTSGSDIVGAVYEGDLSTSGDLDVSDDTLLASTTPFTISTQGTYGTASIGDDGEWVYKLDNGNADVRALNSGDTLTDTFVVDVNRASGGATTQTITITISGRTDVFGTNGIDSRFHRGSDFGDESNLGDESTSDNQAIFGFNSFDTLRGGSGDDLLVGGYDNDTIDLSAGGADTVVYRINSSDGDGLVKAEDGFDRVIEFTPGEDKLVILDVNGSPTTLAGLFDSLTKDAFRIGMDGFGPDARVSLSITFQVGGTSDGGPTSEPAGSRLIIFFDLVTSEALSDRAVWDTLTGGTNFSSENILDVAQLSSLFGGFGRPGYDAALDDGGFISVIGPDDLPDSYFAPVLNVDTSGSDIVGAVYEGDLSTSGDLDVNDDTLLASTTPFTISTQGTYGTASIGDDGEWVYKLDNGNADVRALNSGDTLTDTFVVDVNPASGRAKTQTITITISGRTDVFGTNGNNFHLGDASTSDNQAIFGFNDRDSLTGGSGDDLLVGGYGFDEIYLTAGGTDTVVYRINSSDPDGLVKAEDGRDDIFGFTLGEDKLVILDVNGSPTTLAGLFDSLTKGSLPELELSINGDTNGDRNLSSSELDAGARASLLILFDASGTDDGVPTSTDAGRYLQIYFDRVTSEALNDMAVWDTLTGGTNFSSDRISTVAQLNSLFGGFGRPGYDAALDDGGFISIIGPDDLPSTYFEIVPISGDETGSVTEGGAPGDDNTGTLTASGNTITLVSKETTDSPGMSTGTYGVMRFNVSSGEWVYTLDDRAEALADQQTATETFIFSAGGATFEVTITITGANDAPVVESGNEIGEQAGRVGQEITAIDLSGLFTDVDTGDTFTLTVMVLSSDGSTKSGLDTLGLEYDSDTKMITGTLLDNIDAGPYTIEVIATDGGGSGAASQPSTFNIVVALDNAPVIGGDVDGTIAEDAADPLTGTLTITDADDDALPTVALTNGAGQYGTLTFVASAEGGVWTYELDNTNADVQALKDDTLTDEFTFTAEGADPITVTITISGVNDVPVVDSAIAEQAGRVGQAIAAIDLSGLFTDVDTGDSLTLTVMVLSSDGSTKSGLDTLGLEYDSDTKMITGTLLNSVIAGPYTIEVIATDGGGSGDASQPSTFDIVVAPDNAPVIGGAMDGTIDEDAADSITGTLTITDADNDALPTVELSSGAGQYGTLTFVASAEGGVWTYTLDNANADVLALKDDTLTDEFTFTAEGATPITVTITISGVNDVPVVEFGNEIGEQAGRVGQEITAIDLSGLFTDVDTGDSFTLTVMVLSSDGNTRMALDTTLGLEYDSDTKMITGTLLNSVVAGTYTIEVIATDGGGRGAASQPSTFNIVVAPDNAPVIGGAVDGTIAEDAADPITGTLTITDAEGDALPTVELSSGAGQYGTLTFVASANGGVWTYTLDNANADVQALKGDTLTDEFTFTAEGATPITVTITISGVNDVPVVETEIVGQTGRVGQEITAIDLSGLFTDVDAGDSFTLTVMVLSSDGNTRMALDTTLGLEYDSDTKMITGTLLDSIPTGPYMIEVIATDGSGAASQPSTFTIVVVADGAPVIGGAVDGTIAEDAAGPIMGTLTITDAEGDALPMVVLTNGAGQYGTLTFVASAEGGVWTYELNNSNAAVQALKGDTLTDDFTFTAEGAAPITVTITISGVNDAPTVSGEFFTRVGATGGQFTLSNLSDRFTDVDEGDELTFEVTFHDSEDAEVDIGLTYDSDDDEITGTLTETGTYVIKIVATDKSGATVEATFELNIFSAIPIIQRNSLTYNPDETSITIDETMLKVTSGNESDPTLLVYTITTLPDAGMLLKNGIQLNKGDTFTQEDINNGLITYVPSVSDPSTSQSNPLSFTISDGVATPEEKTLEITSREVVGNTDADEDNLIDLSIEIVPQKIEAGDGSDTIAGGQKDDQIDGGAGDDEIKLTRTVNNVEEDAGGDEVLYEFDYDGVGIDGGDEIVGFKRGQDKLTFIIDRNFDSLTAFLQSLNGADDEDLTADDAFVVTMMWGLDAARGAFYFDSVLLHFKDVSAFGGGRVSSPLVTVTFDERLDFDGLVEILGGAENIANNFDFTHAAFKNLDEVLPRLFGEGSIGFKVVAPPSDTNGASERASEEPLEPPVYETLSEQHGDDLQPTSFELGGGETDII